MPSSLKVPKTWNLANKRLSNHNLKQLSRSLAGNTVIRMSSFIFQIIHSCIILQMLTTLNLAGNNIDVVGTRFLVFALLTNKVKIRSLLSSSPCIVLLNTDTYDIRSEK